MSRTGSVAVVYACEKDGRGAFSKEDNKILCERCKVKRKTSNEMAG